MQNNIDLLVFESKKGTKVQLKSVPYLDALWTNQEQIAMIFECSRSHVAEHIPNIYKEEELITDNKTLYLR
jgi:hypothetical protein